VFNAARRVIFLAAGADKAAALSATLGPTRDTRRWPAQRICPATGQVDWLVDTPAASLLHRVSGVK
jgi:6-phosphogluconolactonase